MLPSHVANNVIFSWNQRCVLHNKSATIGSAEFCNSHRSSPEIIQYPHGLALVLQIDAKFYGNFLGLIQRVATFRMVKCERSFWYLVGGWTNPSEKYSSNWTSSPNRGEHKNIWNQLDIDFLKRVAKKHISYYVDMTLWLFKWQKIWNYGESSTIRLPSHARVSLLLLRPGWWIYVLK